MANPDRTFLIAPLYNDKGEVKKTQPQRQEQSNSKSMIG
jgi:hypothetical protein